MRRKKLLIRHSERSEESTFLALESKRDSSLRSE